MSAVGPRAVRGGLLTYANATDPPVPIYFQYNPSTLKRSLQPQMSGGEQGERSEAVLLTGAPIEVITVEIELDAVGALAAHDPIAKTYGIAPALAALELLVYPSTSDVQSNLDQLGRGVLEVAPYVPALTVFSYGRRQVPVRITGYSITEELFDPELNPIQATVQLNMRVLSYSDLATSTGTLAGEGYQLFVSYQKSLENLRAIAQLMPITGGS